MNNRNQLCECGSGKKFKKCCLLKQEELAKAEQIEWEEWFKKDQLDGQKNLAEAGEHSYIKTEIPHAPVFPETYPKKVVE